MTRPLSATPVAFRDVKTCHQPAHTLLNSLSACLSRCLAPNSFNFQPSSVSIFDCGLLLSLAALISIPSKHWIATQSKQIVAVPSGFLEDLTPSPSNRRA